MHILCTICSDLVNQAESIYVTKCGHVFHHNCLAKWIARSKSCPQCRNKVTDRCMFRLYPTISNENTGDDVTTLQSRLDDAQLQLREQKTLCKEKEERLAVIDAELKKNEELLRMCEKKIVVRDSAVAALKEQLEYVKIQNRETQRLKEENESLKKNIQTMNGLQKVLNATTDEVEMMLQGYSDVKTVATFATALKRALRESESKKAETRDRLQAVKQQLAAEKNTVADLQAKLRSAEEQIAQYRREKSQDNKRNAVEAFDGNTTIAEETAVKLQRIDPPETKAECASNMSFTTLVNSIETSDSPYLRLKQSNLALAALQQRHPVNVPDKSLKPSEFAILNSAQTSLFKKSDNLCNKANAHKLSIFHKKEPAKVDFEMFEQVSDLDVSYDGLGGHSKPSLFPVPYTKSALKALIPRLSAKHKLKRPNTAGSQDIGKMLEKIRENNV
ncbi:unnamed protein product [Parnassius mnemosyne]|uniref:RING-type domain-containing protein n=1 Tax=Parnassius mnemosyne TaxID=213953 RepID=A0AAV1LF47_9NEOP